VALVPVPSMPPLVVVVHDDPGTADSLRHAVESASGWQVLTADPSPAGLAAALAAGPSVALVGCHALANLPADCRTPIVAIGDDDRPGDVRAALAVGARSLLAWPDGAADLPGELARVAATGQPGSADGLAGLVVATRGVQGGAGTTTVAVHLAAAWSRWGPAPVLLLDLAGGLAFRLDLGAAPTWSTLTPPAAVDPSSRSILVDAGGPLAAAVADGVGRSTPVEVVAGGLDAGTLAGALAEPWAGLSVLPLAGLADGAPDPPPEPVAVQQVLEVARTTFRVIVVDLPATDGPAVGTALSQADVLVAVGRCETAGVRALQAALEAWAAAGRDPDAAGAVVTGVRPRAPLAPREVRAALGDRLWGLVPDAAAELAAAAEDGVLLLDRHDLSAVQAMVTLANRVVPFAAASA
jgi:cellulose biosynthesis protein BcsQ